MGSRVCAGREARGRRAAGGGRPWGMVIVIGLWSLPLPAAAAGAADPDAAPVVTAPGSAPGEAGHSPPLRGESGFFVIDSRLGSGLSPGIAAGPTLPFLLGPAWEAPLGAAGVGVLHPLSPESGGRPSLAVAGALTRAAGENAPRGWEATLLGIVTKTVGDLDTAPRLHLNLGWTYQSDPDPEESRDRYVVGLGFSQELAPDLTIAAGVFRRSERPGSGKGAIEAGLRYQIDADAVLSFGLGAGLRGSSPDLHALIGFRYAFGAPGR